MNMIDCFLLCFVRSRNNITCAEIMPKYFLEKHPRGLWWLAAASGLHDFAFGIIASLLILYLNNSLQLSLTKSYNLFAAVMSLAFTLPLLGGYLAEKLGYKITAIIGMLLAVIAALVLSIPNINAMYLGIATFIFSNGFITPAIYSLVGLCYQREDPRRDSGYTIYYLIFNIGFFISVAGGGFLATYLGYNKTFIIAAIALALSLIVFLSGLKIIQPASGNTMQAPIKWNRIIIVSILIIAALIGIPICMELLEHLTLDHVLLLTLTVVASIGLFWKTKHRKEKVVRHRLIAFLILCIISIAFWSAYMLEQSLLTIFIEKNVNRQIVSLIIPPSTYHSLDAFFVILLGIFFSWLWQYLERKQKAPSLPAKFSSSLIIMGVGYLILVIGIYFADYNHLINSAWIILAYLCFAAAELFISPIGLSMVGRLVPKGKDGFGMGIRQIYIGFSAIISGYLADLTVLRQSASTIQSNPIFSAVFLKIGLSVIGVGIFSIFLIPTIKRLISFKQ